MSSMHTSALIVAGAHTPSITRRLAAVIWVATMLVPSSSPAASPSIRGMTVSCPGYGRIWGSEAFSRSLHELKTIGVTWVAIHPYADVRTNGRVTFTDAQRTGYLRSAVQRAKRVGIHLFWKPHLAYWGSFDWRGSIDFADEASRKRFAKQYRAFIVDQARFAERHQLPLFAVGVELERLVHYQDYWRSLIRDVRKVYSGKLTYAANWDGLQRVGFWDALDYIGVQGYFPLAQQAEQPTKAALRLSWRRTLNELEHLSTSLKRPVLFTEIGYPSAKHAAATPWKRGSFFSSTNSQLRNKLIEIALQQLEDRDFIAGMFWWKWIPGRTRGDFAMQPPQVRSLLRRYWAD